MFILIFGFSTEIENQYNEGQRLFFFTAKTNQDRNIWTCDYTFQQLASNQVMIQKQSNNERKVPYWVISLECTRSCPYSVCICNILLLLWEKTGVYTKVMPPSANSQREIIKAAKKKPLLTFWIVPSSMITGFLKISLNSAGRNSIPGVFYHIQLF